MSGRLCTAQLDIAADRHLAEHHEARLDRLLAQEGQQRDEERHPRARLPPAGEQVDDLDVEVEAADVPLHPEQALRAAQVVERGLDRVARRPVQSAGDAELAAAGRLADSRSSAVATSINWLDSGGRSLPEDLALGDEEPKPISSRLRERPRGDQGRLI